MFEHVRKSWRSLRKSEPGQRFQNRYHRRQSRSVKPSRLAMVLRLAGGAGLAFLGVVMLFTPGPGLVFMAAGAALLGSESRVAAAVLDRIEVLMRAMAARVEAWRRR